MTTAKKKIHFKFSWNTFFFWGGGGVAAFEHPGVILFILKVDNLS